MTSSSLGAPQDTERVWTADYRNGNYSNLLFCEEFEDPDATRVGNNDYLAGLVVALKGG